jgi:hypothetical protein
VFIVVDLHLTPTSPRPDFRLFTQVSPLQVAGHEALSPVHVHRAAPPTSDHDDVPSLRSSASHVAAQQSLSARAALFGAVPVAAVHDQQAAPHQWRGEHQTRPLYIERFE